MNTPTKAKWHAPLVAAVAGGRYDAEALAGDWRTHELNWPGTCTQRIAFIERQVKHAPAWLNEWDVRLLAAKEWELK